jgi:hypothetical protein
MCIIRIRNLSLLRLRLMEAMAPDRNGRVYAYAQCKDLLNIHADMQVTWVRCIRFTTIFLPYRSLAIDEIFSRT